MKRLRRELDPAKRQAADRAICSRVLQAAEACPGKPLFLYIAKEDETNLNEAVAGLLAAGRTVAVPRVYGREMRFQIIRSFADLEDGVFGLREPLRTCPVIVPEACPVFTPGLAFGTAGERIGYGAHYYDSYFTLHPGNTLIGTCYEFQYGRSFETEERDVPVNGIITEERFDLFRPGAKDSL